MFGRDSNCVYSTPWCNSIYDEALSRKPKSSLHLRRLTKEVRDERVSEFDKKMEEILTKSESAPAPEVLPEILDKISINNNIYLNYIDIDDSDRYIEYKTLLSSVELKNGDVIDPVIVYPIMRNLDLGHKYNYFLSGKEIAEIRQSDYALPSRIIEAAWDTPSQLHRCGEDFDPLLISINGNAIYLVKAFSEFFVCGDLKGSNVDPEFYANPKDWNNERYVWGDSMLNEITAAYVNLGL